MRVSEVWCMALRCGMRDWDYLGSAGSGMAHWVWS